MMGNTVEKMGLAVEDTANGRLALSAYRGRTIMLVIFHLFQTIGYYGFSSWLVTFLVSQGIEVTKSLAYTFVTLF
jgi:putative MFS transporter